MENQELTEIAEHVHRPSDRVIGVTMAIVAALLAVTTLMGHRLHTEEVVLQTKAADGWAYYQAKNSRYHMYETDAKLATLIGPHGQAAAADWAKKGEEEKEQAEEIALLAEMVAGGKTLTLLCSSACQDAERCHRSLLKALIEERLAARVL